MVFPILLMVGVALLAVLVFVPALLLNYAAFRFLTNPLLYVVLIVGLALFILHKLGLLKKLLAMVKL